MPAGADPQKLQAFPLFQGLEPAQLTSLAARLRPTTVAAGTMLMSAEQPGEVAYLLVKGTVKVHVEQADGTDVILAILGPGDLVGELSLLDKQGRSASVVTLTQAELLWLDRATLEHALHTMPTLALNLVRLLVQRLRLANAQIQSLATKDVFGRVASMVLAFGDRYGQKAANGDVIIPLHLTQSDLASLVGASRVRVNQVLSYYRERQYLSVQPNYHIVVHNRAALVQRCG